MSNVSLVESSELSSTFGGGGGFGSSGPAIRLLETQGGVLHDRGAHEHDGREAHVHEGGLVGGEQSGQMPRGGETMGVFLERLRGGDLREFSWLFPRR